MRFSIFITLFAISCNTNNTEPGRTHSLVDSTKQENHVVAAAVKPELNYSTVKSKREILG
jgi:hypothetical protein